MLDIKTEESFVQVVEEYSDMMYRIAYQNFMNAADAQDVVQDVFEKILKREHLMFQDQEHLKAWLIRVTVNQCHDVRRMFSRRREETLEGRELVLENKEDVVLGELKKLPKLDRTIIYLYYYEGYKIREIAEILKKNQNTINSRLTRGREKLKNILGKESEE